MSKKPFHELVAEQLIQQLKQGTAPWQRPWKPGNPNTFVPTNPMTGKRYKGINAISLMTKGYTEPRWMTYKQAEQLNAQVRKGEKGSAIQYWKFTETKIKKDEKGNPVLDAEGRQITIEIRLERPRVFYATVFNAEQIDGLPPRMSETPAWDPLERAEQILKSSGATLHHGEENRAFYRPSTDSIHLPDKSQFLHAECYYATALHELAHWTGHAARMDRDLIHPFGSEGYAKEELRAEITSMILGDELGIGHDPGQHASYVGSWIKVLQDDPLEIFRAASDAEKIQEFIVSLDNSYEQVQNTALHYTQINAHLEINELTQTPIPATENFVMELDPQRNVKPPKESEHNLHFNPGTIDEGIALLNEADLKRRTAEQQNKSVSSDIATEKTWLDVPFKQKEVAKELAGLLPDGRKAIAWDKEQLRWFAHPGADLEPLAPWLPSQVKDSALKEQTIASELLASEKTWLAVPYVQREAVKQIAGVLADGTKAVEWDKAAKCWFAHPGANLEQLKPWLVNTSQERQQPALTPVQEFSDALKCMGSIVTGDHPMMDGKKHRISVEGDKKGEKSGFYVGHLDGHPAGYIKNNRTGIEMKWNSKGYSLTDEERAAMYAKAAIKSQERVELQKHEQEQASQRVSKQLADLVPMITPTPYLQKKQIDPHTGLFTDTDGQTTYIPAIDANGKLWTMQYIKEDGTKRFAKNSRKEGCFHVLGGLNALAAAPALVIAEGYATAASISQELGFATISAFDAGNLVPVARALREHFPDKPIFIMGDDDKHLELTQGINPGKIKAQEAAMAVNGMALFPIFAPDEQLLNPRGFSDFNDLATKSALGSEGLSRQVKSIVNHVVQNNGVGSRESIQCSSIKLQKNTLAR